MTEPDVDNLLSPEAQERLRQKKAEAKQELDRAMAASGKPVERLREQYGDEAFQTHDVQPAAVREAPLSERQESLVAEVPGPSKPRSMPTHEIDRVRLDEACGRKLSVGVPHAVTRKLSVAVPPPPAANDAAAETSGTSVETGGLDGLEQRESERAATDKPRRGWLLALGVVAALIVMFLVMASGREESEPKEAEEGAASVTPTEGLERAASALAAQASDVAPNPPAPPKAPTARATSKPMSPAAIPAKTAKKAQQPVPAAAPPSASAAPASPRPTPSGNPTSFGSMDD